MSELETLLNPAGALKLTETSSPKQAKKPTAPANKVDTLTAQARTIDSASVGGAVFRSAADIRAASLAIKVQRT